MRVHRVDSRMCRQVRREVEGGAHLTGVWRELGFWWVMSRGLAEASIARPHMCHAFYRSHLGQPV